MGGGTIELVLTCQSIQGKKNVLADSLSLLSAIRRRSVRVCFFRTGTGIDDTTGSKEAPIISWGPHDASCSILAPETIVSGSPLTSGGRSDLSTVVTQSPQPTTPPLSSSRYRQAVSSCLETIQLFARSQGFSSRVVKQLGFAWRT